ncbi:MAG: preprotein translocase subunit YajC [Nitrospinota bacterium]|nr:preprotein translocase subunit YajC [Nitrospinota bacterium]MDH5679152.1 preprotein translocase subunit YajC [Nitrospinota bacterium]
MFLERFAGILTSFAPAPEGAPDTEGHMTVMLVFYGLLFLIIYMFLFRPQMKKSKEAQDMQSELGKGDSVVTSGGLYGVIHKIKDDIVTLTVAENVRIKVRKSSISERVKESLLKDSD